MQILILTNGTELKILDIIKTIGAIALTLAAALGCAAEPDAASPAGGDASPVVAPTAGVSAPAPSSPRQSPPSDGGDVRTLDAEEDLQIVTLLGFDAIPAILEPEFVGAAQADEWLEDDDLIIGVSINGDSRAYSVPMLSAHEIVNDVVGGEPVAVTW